MHRAFKTTLLALSIFASAGAGAQESWPQRPITFVVPYPPGGPADLIARSVARKMSDFAKQSIIVENKAGASGNIAGEYIARAPKDGYTLLFGSSPVLVINPGLYPKLGFDPLRDFQPIADFGSLPNAVLVNAALPVSSVQDLIAYARREPTTFASAGSGGTTHLAGLLFAQAAGLKDVTHIPYKGSAPALQSLLASQVTMTFTDVYTAYPFLTSGKLKVLGITSAQPSALLPDVRTLQQQGIPGIDVSVFFALLGPAGMPPSVVQRLSALSQQVLQDPEIRSQFKERGLELPSDGSPETLRTRMERETATWGQLIKSTGAAVD